MGEAGFREAPSSLPPLGPSEVHVWLANLDIPAEVRERDTALLAPDERERAARFHFQRDRRRYTMARAILRKLLGGYVGAVPEELQFTYNHYGKPALAERHPCRFNLAHSHGWAAFAFTQAGDVGVDLERLRPDFAGQEIAERFFSPAEAAALRRVSDTARTKAFFDCWTRKEAFIKAKGMGIFLGLDTFAVTLQPGEAPALLWHRGDSEAAARWTIFELEPPDGYVGAVAVEGTALTFKSWRWCSG